MSFHVVFAVGAAASDALRWTAWMLTYFAHALTWAAAAALLVRTSARSPARASTLWKLALVGPLVTTLTAIVLPGVAVYTLSRPTATAAPHALAARTKATSTIDVPKAARLTQGRWESRLLTALLVGACGVGCLRYAGSAARFSRALRRRTRISDARLLPRFEVLTQRFGLQRVVLTESAAVSVPMVLGRREVCLPRGRLAQFDDDEIDAIFAHELSHLERGDGVWYPLIGLIEAVLWMQPFNRLLSKRWRAATELACDDRAAAITGAPRALASALLRMAEHSMTVRASPLVPAMAAIQPRLERVRRLVATRETAEVAPGSARPLLALVLLGYASPSLGIDIAPARPLPAMLSVAATAIAPPDRGSAARSLDALVRRERELERDLDHLLSHASLGATQPLTVMETRRALEAVRARRSETEAHSADAPTDSRTALPHAGRGGG